jgi:hypothetical protein
MPHSEAHKRAVAKYVSTHMDQYRDITRRGVAKYYLTNSENISLYKKAFYLYKVEVARLRNIYNCME